jgi:hypothetical protein
MKGEPAGRSNVPGANVSPPRRDRRIWQALKNFPRFNGNRLVFEPQHQFVIREGEGDCR